MVDALRLHVCNRSYDFSTAAALPPTVFDEFTGYQWTRWPRLVAPGGDPHAVRLSLPANNVGDGRARSITGTVAGRPGTDRIDASPIMDTDGLDRRRFHVPVAPGGRGRHLQRGGYFRRDRRDLHPDDRRRGQEESRCKVSFTDELSGVEDAHQRGVSLVRHADRRHGDLNAAQDDGHLRRARAHRVLGRLRQAGDGRPARRPSPSSSDTTTKTATLVCGLGHRPRCGSPTRWGADRCGDLDTDGISWAANALGLNGGTITGTGNAVAATLTHGAQPALVGDTRSTAGPRPSRPPRSQTWR